VFSNSTVRTNHLAETNELELLRVVTKGLLNGACYNMLKEEQIIRVIDEDNVENQNKYL
jgi:hypothetical protein